MTNNSSQRGSRKLSPAVLLLPAMSGSGGNSREKTCCCGSCCTLLISLGLAVLIYWAIFQPHQIRATVEYAELSNLAVSNASSPVAVTYHVAVNLSLYNPSKRVNIYYDAIDAELLGRPPPARPGGGNGTAPAAFVPGGWCGGDATCGAVDNDWVLRPGPGAERFQRLIERIVRSEGFLNRQCQ